MINNIIRSLNPQENTKQENTKTVAIKKNPINKLWDDNNKENNLNKSYKQNDCNDVCAVRVIGKNDTDERKKCIEEFKNFYKNKKNVTYTSCNK